jgi:preprotein translocase subunit Sss1
MSKHGIIRLYVGSLLALVGGLVLLLVASKLAVANDVFEMNGPDVVGVRSGPFGWTMLVLAAIAVLVIVAAAVVQFVAWILAVLDAARRPDKTWLAVLLVTGLLSFGFVGMLVYVLAVPESEPAAEPQPWTRGPVTEHAPHVG